MRQGGGQYDDAVDLVGVILLSPDIDCRRVRKGLESGLSFQLVCIDFGCQISLGSAGGKGRGCTGERRVTVA